MIGTPVRRTRRAALLLVALASLAGPAAAPASASQVAVTGYDCGADAKAGTMLPTVTVERISADFDTWGLKVTLRLYVGEDYKQLATGRVDEDGNVTPGVAQVPPGDSADMRPFGAVYGDGSQYGGPPLARDQDYRLEINVYDFDAGESTIEDVTCHMPLPPPVTVTVSAGGSGHGSITSSAGGIDCPGTCSGEVPWGSTVTLTAHPQDDSTFEGFNAPECASSGATCTLTPEDDRTVQGSFKLRQNEAALGPCSIQETEGDQLQVLGAGGFSLDERRAPGTPMTLGLEVSLARLVSDGCGDHLVPAAFPVGSLPILTMATTQNEAFAYDLFTGLWGAPHAPAIGPTPDLSGFDIGGAIPAPAPHLDLDQGIEISFSAGKALENERRTNLVSMPTRTLDAVTQRELGISVNFGLDDFKEWLKPLRFGGVPVTTVGAMLTSGLRQSTNGLAGAWDRFPGWVTLPDGFKPAILEVYRRIDSTCDGICRLTKIRFPSVQFDPQVALAIERALLITAVLFVATAPVFVFLARKAPRAERSANAPPAPRALGVSRPKRFRPRALRRGAYGPLAAAKKAAGVALGVSAPVRMLPLLVDGKLRPGAKLNVIAGRLPKGARRVQLRLDGPKGVSYRAGLAARNGIAAGRVALPRRLGKGRWYLSAVEMSGLRAGAGGALAGRAELRLASFAVR